MNASNRGLKHTCPECATKYYDLGKKSAVCPKCGAKAPPPKPRSTPPPAGATGRPKLHLPWK